MDPIDLMVGMYGLSDGAEACIAKFLVSLYDKCDLREVNVFCIEREHQPLSESMRTMIRRFGYELISCPLPPGTDCREDTSQFCNWMVDNCGSAPWFALSHFDVIFVNDYIGFARMFIPMADMVGNHCDGVVLVNREAYHKCGVGFWGLDRFSVFPAGENVRILPSNTPNRKDGQHNVLHVDVGELLALRMHTLGLRHVQLRNRNGVGKCDLFVHTRRGSGHSGGGRDNDTQPHLY